jgi:hypothetical protein
MATEKHLPSLQTCWSLHWHNVKGRFGLTKDPIRNVLSTDPLYQLV